jgi:hypothetical protein
MQEVDMYDILFYLVHNGVLSMEEYTRLITLSQEEIKQELKNKYAN